MWPFDSVYRRVCGLAFEALKADNADAAKMLFEKASGGMEVIHGHMRALGPPTCLPPAAQ